MCPCKEAVWVLGWEALGATLECARPLNQISVLTPCIQWASLSALGGNLFFLDQPWFPFQFRVTGKSLPQDAFDSARPPGAVILRQDL